MKVISCTDKFGNVNNFEYTYSIITDAGIKSYEFEVGTMDRDYPFKYLIIISISKDDKRVVTMLENSFDPSLKGKGIFFTMLEEAKAILGQPIYSSSNNPSQMLFDPEYRSEFSTALWKRLEATGKASYLPDLDRFIFH